MQSRIHFIAGPTASGKSARALEVAQAQNGVVINADAIQLYEELRIVSARPDAEMVEGVPHRLYGIIKGDQAVSAGIWLDWVKPEIEAAWKAGRLPVICGGTGLYINALREGLSEMPEVPPAIRQQVAARLEEIGKAAFYEELRECDPAAAAHIGPYNTQRLLRAREVREASGKPFSEWMQAPKQPLFPDAEYVMDVVEIARDELYRRCDARFDAMMAQGAIQEVGALLAKGYPPSAMVMKAVGVAELAGYLHGDHSLEKAVELAKRNTRRYAKRQLTWFRHQI
jgi:tRNA dimethylallyltransferase